MMMEQLPRGQADLQASPLEPLASLGAGTRGLRRILALALVTTAIAGILIGIDIAAQRRDTLIEIFIVFALGGVVTAVLLGFRALDAASRTQHLLATQTATLLRAKQAAESANLAKSRYLASVSHEIRSPLNAIYGYAQLFERGEGTNAREAGRVILRCSEHLTNLVEGLLDISQLEFGVLRVRSEEVRLAPFLDQVVSMMRPSAFSKGLAFIYETPERLPEMVRLDQSRFRQVLINLLSNAIKFTEHGSVALRVTYSGQIAVFEVRDTGPGIPPEDHERIFERFERGSTATPTGGRVKPGAGLGLAIARTIVEILGGKLELESELGVGTCFRITMMLGEVSGRIAPPAPARQLVGYEGSRRNILLVEDDDDQRLFLQRLLTSLGFVVIAHPNGELALAAIVDRDIDLAILDISLPGMSGWETGVGLRRHFGNGLQILMLSANSEELHRPEFDASAHDRFLVKPVEFEMLIETVGDLLGLTWLHDDRAPASKEAPHQDGESEPNRAMPSIDSAAQPHIVRLREFLRIGYVRGIEAEIKLLEEAAPDAEALVRRLYDHLDRYDLAGMAKLLQES
jgi:signal transduction histidine kinase/DNA-binding NarL/FixJ family response regulator